MVVSLKNEIQTPFSGWLLAGQTESTHESRPKLNYPSSSCGVWRRRKNGFLFLVLPHIFHVVVTVYGVWFWHQRLAASTLSQSHIDDVYHKTFPASICTLYVFSLLYSFDCRPFIFSLNTTENVRFTSKKRDASASYTDGIFGADDL